MTTPTLPQSPSQPSNPDELQEGAPTARQARDALARLTAAGYVVEADDFFVAHATRGGMEISPDDLGEEDRQALEVLRAHIEAAELGDLGLERYSLADDARLRGATPELAEALANVHVQLKAGDMPGFDADDLRDLLAADDDAAGYLDDLEARIGVDVSALRAALFPSARSNR